MKINTTNFTYILIIVVFFSTLKSNAQAGIGLPFGFGVTPTATNITGATTINLTVRPVAIQDEMDTLINIPAAGTITFGGIVYNQFAVSTNGWLALVPSTAGLPASNPFPPNPTNSLSTSALGYPVIAPLWDDMAMASIQYNWTAPVLTVKWTGRWDKTNASLTNAFGVKIDGTTGICTFFYNNVAYTPTSPSASIGIAGICTGDFTSVNVLSATTAASDSVTEWNVTSRPNNVNYIFTPYNPHNNCSGTYIAKNLGTMTSSCTLSGNYSTVHATTSGSGMACAAGEVKDVWFSVIKPLGVTNVRVTTAPGTCQVLGGTTVEVRASCAGASLGCSTTGTTYPTFGEVDIARPCAAETLYVRVTGDGDAIGKFRICAMDNGGGAGGGATCGAPTFICSLPYNQTGLSTLGAGNEYDSTNTVCHSLYARGEDYIFSYTPTVSQCIRVSVTSTGTSPGVFIYNNCPDSSGTGPTYCLGSAEGVTGTVTINSVTLLAGTTYYIMVDNLVVGGSIPFDISVSSLGTANTYDNCATPINLGSISNGQSCVFQTYSTECSTPSAVGTVPVPSCINTSAVPSNFIDGVTGDVWLRFTAAFSGALQISTQQGSVNPTANAAMAVYTGTCGAFTQYACDYNSGTNGMPSLSIPINNGVTYYVRVWSENPESQGTFDICLQSACSPPNDLPCGAVLLPIGGTTTGFNICTSATSEPPNSAQCISGGTINTVWYKTVVPASGQVHIRTHPLTLTDTQIQAFTFASGCSNAATTYVNKGCNDDGPGCGGGFTDFSDLNVTGLVPGDTLFIAVDGTGSLTGSFEITMIDGLTPTFPPVYQQDCLGAQVLCSTSNVVVADPGFRNFGNICDLPTGITCTFPFTFTQQELNSVWYQFTVDPALSGGTANLAFSATTLPNVDLDFYVWDITSSSTPCASIASGALSPAACNIAPNNSTTGLAVGGTGAFSQGPTFTGAPRTYLLLINNWNSSINAAFTLNWGTTPISTAASTAIWTGLTDTLFTTSTNWGDCGGTPACGIDAIVNPTANGRQPSVSGSQSVKNLTINAGATLKLLPGSTLTVCGNLTNFGSLVCGAGSTIIFIGTTIQTITGNLTGANGFANLSVLKTANSVILANNIDVKENFATLSATSIFNIGGKYMKVAGNFTNNTSPTTFTGVGGSTVEFNGAGNQFLNNINGATGITMNRVFMNKTGGKLYLSSANSSLNVDSILTLTSGNIVTRNFASTQVFVKYGISAAITGHSALSYIDGKLRRAVYTGTPLTLPFSLDYPVGDSLLQGGYELANVTFTGGTVIPDLQGTFNPWAIPATPPLGPIANECMIANYNPNPFFNHGYWTFSKTNPTPFNGIYRLTMNNIGYNNNAGFNGWTVAKADIAADPNLTASWSLIGQCAIASTATVTQRVNINGTNPYSVTTTLGSNIIYTSNTTALSTGAAITGTGIPAGSVITAILNSGAFTISNPATASGTVTGSIGSTANSATSFNHHYAIAQSTVPLPIELLSFTAEPEKDYVVCNWTTASETNNAYFEVLRSFDGKEFNAIGNVNGFGAGTSTTNRSYSFVDDEERCNSIRYYQLKQFDIDNKSTLSDIVAVNCNNKDETISIYPNPATETLTYQFYQNGDEVLEVQIVDMTGRTVFIENTVAIRGFNSTTVSIENLAGGAYNLLIRSLNTKNSTSPRHAQFFKK